MRNRSCCGNFQLEPNFFIRFEDTLHKAFYEYGAGPTYYLRSIFEKWYFISIVVGTYYIFRWMGYSSPVSTECPLDDLTPIFCKE